MQELKVYVGCFSSNTSGFQINRVLRARIFPNFRRKRTSQILKNGHVKKRIENAFFPWYSANRNFSKLYVNSAFKYFVDKQGKIGSFKMWQQQEFYYVKEKLFAKLLQRQSSKKNLLMQHLSAIFNIVKIQQVVLKGRRTTFS